LSVLIVWRQRSALPKPMSLDTIFSRSNVVGYQTGPWRYLAAIRLWSVCENTPVACRTILKFGWPRIAEHRRLADCETPLGIAQRLGATRYLDATDHHFPDGP